MIQSSTHVSQYGPGLGEDPLRCSLIDEDSEQDVPQPTGLTCPLIFLHRSDQPTKDHLDASRPSAATVTAKLGNLDSPEPFNIPCAAFHKLVALFAGSLKDLTELNDLSSPTMVTASASTLLQPPAPRRPPPPSFPDISEPIWLAKHREEW